MKTTVLIAALLAAPAALAGSITEGSLTIDTPVARETPKGARAGAGFFAVTNTGSEADRLVAVTADFPRVEIHETIMEDGIARMQQIEGLVIEPGETVTLQPGGKHIMFMGLSETFDVGEEIPATLVFERAGAIAITFEVRPIADLMPKHDMGDQSHKHQ